jgi:hypothetical protein
MQRVPGQGLSLFTIAGKEVEARATRTRSPGRSARQRRSRGIWPFRCLTSDDKEVLCGKPVVRLSSVESCLVALSALLTQLVT